MGGTVFWDVDTQYDFMFSDGRLYVPGAEEILPQLARLTREGRRRGLRLWGSVDHHTLDDAEIAAAPDFVETYPPHCLAGTPGAAKVDATRVVDPLWVDGSPVDPARLLEHGGEVIFRKQRFDVFTNPNTEAALRVLRPDEIVVFGVALDVCNRHAIEGMLARGHRVAAVTDATRPIRKDVGERLLADWARRGVRLVTSAALLDETQSRG
jgi:nicotinamidase/pyrazinamidase